MNNTAQRPPPDAPEARGHEPTDVNPSIVSLFTAGLLLLLAIAVWLVGEIGRSFETSIQRDDRARNPLLERETPPEPRLEVDPAAGFARWRKEQESRRSSFEFDDEKSEIVRIPVEEAMKILAKRGFPEAGGHPESPQEGGARP